MRGDFSICRGFGGSFYQVETFLAALVAVWYNGLRVGGLGSFDGCLMLGWRWALLGALIPVWFWFAVKFQHVRFFAPAIALQGSILLRKGVLRTRWDVKS